MSARIDPAALAASLRRLRQEPPSQVREKSLDHLVTACVELFGVGGSGLMLADGGGDLRYAVTTDPTSQELEDAQLVTGQGPCVDTYANDELVTSSDMYSTTGGRDSPNIWAVNGCAGCSACRSSWPVSRLGASTCSKTVGTTGIARSGTG